MLYYRQKIILALLERFNGCLNKTDLQKYLFLLTRNQAERSFDFVPYHYGCYSFQANKDLEYLQDAEYLKKGNNWALQESKTKYNDLLTDEDRKILFNLHKKFKDINSDNLIKYVYVNYPYYTIKSTIKDRVLSQAELKNINNTVSVDFDINNQEKSLFTIGYEGISVEEYLNKLIQNNIKILVDVRKNPLSRKYGFSKQQLKFMVERLGIEYLHMPELGIETDKRKNLETLEDYNKLFEDYEKTLVSKDKELLEIKNLINSKKRVALTCFEKDVKMCHRTRIKNRLEETSQGVFKIVEL